MGKRRGNNEGSIYKTKEGKWRGQVQIGFKPDGSRKFVKFSGDTRQEVAEQVAQAISDISKNTFIEPNRLTFEDWIWNWLRVYKKPYIRPNTYTRYLYVTRDYIVPALGKIKIKSLKSMHIQKLYHFPIPTLKIIPLVI